jgi:DNA-directed RNA polymerase subunit beta'
VELQARIKVRFGEEIIQTTVGRVLLNETLPKEFRFINEVLDKNKLSQIVSDCYKMNGHDETIELLDRLKKIGFEEATRSGISMAIDDLRIPEAKWKIIRSAKEEVDKVELQYRKGLITDGERYNKIIDIWTHATDEVADEIMNNLDIFNPLYMMARSGARGSKQQIRQLAGMRGLMAKPSGEIIESPITANFREGLTVLEYFISTHGARKGLADTALKTADSGYLTRRLVDVAQDVIIAEKDCNTLNGVMVSAIIEGDEVVASLKERIIGRVALDNVVDVITDDVIVRANEEIDEEKAERIEKTGIETIHIRSVLTCESRSGVCAKCYGRNLATQRPVDLGEAVGIIAAQSIGEPGTQLTMRTFHIGGTAFRIVEQTYLKAKNKGFAKYHNLRVAKVKRKNEYVVLNRNGQISINDSSGRELERYPVPHGATLNMAEGEVIKKDDIFVKWDPYTSPILTEVNGKVKFEDIIEEVTMRRQLNETTGLYERVIVEHKGEYHPQIVILDEKEEILGFYPIPAGAHIVVGDGQFVEAGNLLAKTPRKITKTRDITGGLPRVAELFEARRPKDPAIISEIDGIVELSESKKGQRRVIIKSTGGMSKEYIIPHGKHLNVYKSDKVTSGQADRL